VPVTRFDDHGLGEEANNLAAIGSLKGYRALRFGANVELFITDQHSYRSREPTARPEAKGLLSPDFPDMMPVEAMEMLDAGRDYGGGRPPNFICFGDELVPNFRAKEPPQTILGAEQKEWLKSRIRASRAPWKLWAVTQATMEARADPQNLPEGVTKPWPGAGFAGCFGGGDHSSAFVERAEIYDLVAKEGITGFCTIAGDRHSFWAGYAAKALPPAKFDPVGLSFVVGSISSPTIAEYYEYRTPKNHPLRALYLKDVPGARKPEPAINMLLKHGVRSCLEYARSGDIRLARARTNPDNAPHVEFVDMSGHGYAVVRANERAITTEFVCIPRPIDRIASADGGPLRYRVRHSAALWAPRARPLLIQEIVDGDPGLAI
jgi:alkaline phosphatase D